MMPFFQRMNPATPPSATTEETTEATTMTVVEGPDDELSLSPIGVLGGEGAEVVDVVGELPPDAAVVVVVVVVVSVVVAVVATVLAVKYSEDADTSAMSHTGSLPCKRYMKVTNSSVLDLIIPAY